MLLAAMLAMVLVAAAPAFGQATAVDDTSDVTYDDSFNQICPQVVAVFGAQTNYGDANAAAVDESEAAAEVAQEFGLEVNQVNACLGGISADNGDDDGDDDSDDAVVVQYDSASASASASASTTTAVLPETGGSSLLALGAGALLVAGGLLARRIVR